MPEYGRHIQKLVDNVITIEDKAKRQKEVEQIIALMGFLNPHLKNEADYEHKLWDHIFIMSDFKLECDSPYPVPKKEVLFAKPDKFAYPATITKHRHYGRHIMSMIEKASTMEDAEKKAGFVYTIANFMKRTYSLYNKEGVNDDIIREDLKRLSDGKLILPDDEVIVVRNLGKGPSSSSNNKRRGRNNNKKKKNNNNRNRNRR